MLRCFLSLDTMNMKFKRMVSNFTHFVLAFFVVWVYALSWMFNSFFAPALIKQGRGDDVSFSVFWINLHSKLSLLPLCFTWKILLSHLYLELRAHHHPLVQIQITAITSHFRDNKSPCFLSLNPLFYFKERIYMGLGFKRLITAWHCNTEYTFYVGIGLANNRVTRLRRHVTRVTWHCVTWRDWCDVLRRGPRSLQRPITGHWRLEIWK